MVLRDDDPRLPELEAEGWEVTARSWGAQLDVSAVHHEALRRLVVRARAARVRPLTTDDVPAILALDRATSADYPGGVATTHPPLTPVTATPAGRRRAWGADDGGGLVAVTFVYVARAPGSSPGVTTAETAFTVVAAHARGRGLATAVKAAAVLDLADAGVRVLRTGGSDLNTAILGANARLGFVVDERWLTLRRPPR